MRLEDFKVTYKIQLAMIWLVVIRMVLCTIIPVLRAVNVNWNDDGWNVNANSVENSNEWNAGNQVFSRNYCIFLLGLWLGSFRLYCRVCL